MKKFDEGWCCQNCESINNKLKHQIDKKVYRQSHYFSTGLPYAEKQIRGIYYSMIHTTYISTEDMIDNLQSLKCESKLIFYQNFNIFYDEMNYRRQSGYLQFEEDVFSKGAQGINIKY